MVRCLGNVDEIRMSDRGENKLLIEGQNTINFISLSILSNARAGNNFESQIRFMFVHTLNVITL